MILTMATLTSSIIFLAGLLSFVSSWGHILSTLVALEFMALATYFSISTLLASTPLELFNSLIYISVAVCEGALGLSILVVATKYTGNDMLSSLSLISW